METELSKAERTRQFIIESTSGIFNKKGYAGTSMSDLTDATGLTKGSIYGNFKNKEEVAVAAFEYNTGKVRKQVAILMDKAPTYYEKLMVYSTVYHNFKSKNFPEGGCPILNTAVDADDTNPLLKEKVTQVIIKWKKRLEDLIQGGIDAGEFKQDVDVSRTALSIIALVEGAIMIARVTGKPSHSDAILQTMQLLVGDLKI